MQQEYYQEYRRGLLQDLIQQEIAENQRIIYQDEDAIAFVPVCARYPYEVWVAPIQPVSSFTELTPEQRWGLAKALKTVKLKYLAGTELAAGMFANDALPEEKAKELQAVNVNLQMPISA